MNATATMLASAWMDTPLGTIHAAADDRGIVMLEFDDGGGLDGGIAECEHPLLAQLECELRQYFAGTRQSFTVPLSIHGEPFERAAWEFLRTIPYGQTRTYGQQARAIGQPNAARAVGGANGRNRIAIVIPCHRVIGAGGNLTGYGGGLHRKSWLLEHEKQSLSPMPFPRSLIWPSHFSGTEPRTKAYPQ